MVVWFAGKALAWFLRLTGAAALCFGVMLAMPLSYPPTLEIIDKTVKTFDRTGMPEVSRFQARDGTSLAFRAYAPTVPDKGRIAILFHGSSASSAEMHPLAKALAARGISVFVPDIRGHGGSGTRGDIGYVGQLEDDLADLVAMIRKTAPDAPLILIGHSSGGGFALRIAGSPIQGLFSKAILLAPYLGYRAPTSRPDAGGWASPDLPRIIAIMILERMGFPYCNGLPALAFAVPANSKAILTPVYTYRLMSNYATDRDYRDDLAAATKPVVVFAGTDDELMFADRYVDALAGSPRTIAVHLIPAVNHMAIVNDTAATAAIVAETLAN